MTDSLRLRFKSYMDGTGDLIVEVQCNGFSGNSSACFGETELIEFAKNLASTFPLPPGAPLTIEGGFWSKSGSGIEQQHVGLQFYPIGSVGQVGCRVLLSTPVYAHERPESQSSLSVELHTTYEQLGVFAKSLELITKGSNDDAVLEAAG